MELKTCNFVEVSELRDVISQNDFNALMDVISDSEISFGSNNRTMVSVGSFFEFIDDALDELTADAAKTALRELVGPQDYIDVEN